MTRVALYAWHSSEREKNRDILLCLGETDGPYSIPADGAKRLRGF